MTKIIEKIKRIKRAIRIFKALEEGRNGWWLKLKGSSTKVLIYFNFNILKNNKFTIFIKKIQLAWLYSLDYELKEDGFYYFEVKGDQIHYNRINY